MKPILFLKAIAGQAGYYLSGSPPRWHKWNKDRPAPADAHAVVSHSAHVKAVLKLKDSHHAKPADPQAMHAEVVALGTHIAEQANAVARLADVRKKILAGISPQKNEKTWAWKAPPEKVQAVIAEIKAKGDAKSQALLAEFLTFQSGDTTKDAALAAAVAHLEEDAKQGNIPAEEQKEDAELVAKLKEAQDDSAVKRPEAKWEGVSFTLTNDTWANQDGTAWYDKGGSGFVALKLIAGMEVDDSDLAKLGKTSRKQAFDIAVDNGVDPVAAINQTFPKGNQGNGYFPEGHVINHGGQNIVLTNGQWQLEKTANRALPTAKWGGETYTFKGDHWTSTNGQYQQGGSAHAGLKLIAGLSLGEDDIKTLGKYSLMDALQMAVDEGVDPLKAMNELFPGGGGWYTKNDSLTVTPDVTLVFDGQNWAREAAVPTVTLNGKPWKKSGKFWVSGVDSVSPGSITHLTLEVLAGKPLAQDYLNDVADAKKKSVVSTAKDFGMEPVDVLNLVYPPTEFNDDGDIKTVYGVPYQFANGKWHEPAVTNKTVKFNGHDFKQDENGVWEDVQSGAQPGTHNQFVLNAMAGLPPSAAEKNFTPGMKEYVVNQLVTAGWPAEKALNHVFPPADAPLIHPKEGDTKEVKGVAYILQNGRWHLLSAVQDAPAQVVSLGTVVKVPAAVKKLQQIDPQEVDDWLGSAPGAAAHDAKFWGLTTKASQTKFHKWVNHAKSAQKNLTYHWADLYQASAKASLFGHHDQVLLQDGSWKKTGDMTLGDLPSIETSTAKILAAVVAAKTGKAPAKTAPSGKLTATLEGDAYHKEGGKWLNAGGYPALTGQSLALDVIAGQKVDAQFLAPLPVWIREQAINNAVAEGADPVKALNTLLPVDPYAYHTATSVPMEGDVKSVNGAKYVMENGAWHDAAQAAPTVTPPSSPDQNVASFEGELYQKQGGQWVNMFGVSVVTSKHLVLDIISGHKTDDDFLSSVPSWVRTHALNQAVAGGVDPTKALNALFPPGADAAEGDLKTINGVTYVLHNGRWHKVTPDAPAAPTPAPPPPANNSVFGIDESLYDWKQTILPNSQVFIAKGLEILKEQIKQGDLSGLKGATKFMSASGKYIVTLPSPMLGKHKFAGKKAGMKALYDYINAIKAAASGKPVPKPAAPAPTPTPTPTPAPPPYTPPKPPVNPGQPQDIAGWTAHPGTQGGYNEGGQYTDQQGKKWYVKFPASEAAARTEVLANALYTMAGAYVPKVRLVQQNGKVGIASLWVEDAKVDKAALTGGALSGLTELFAADAWLANYDVVGNNPVAGKGWDNIVNHHGKALRIEAGGSLDRKGTGGIKPFADTVTDLETFRDASINPRTAAVFGKMTDDQVADSVAQVANIPDEAIEQVVNLFGAGSDADKAKMAATLIARKADMVKKYPGGKAKVAAYQAPTVFHNIKGKLQKWSVLSVSPDNRVITVADPSNQQWQVTMHPSSVAAKHALLQQKFLEMFGLSDQSGRLVENNGQYGVAIKRDNGKPGDDAVREVLESWWQNQPASTLTGNLQAGAERLALLNDNQIDDMIAKVDSGAPVADAQLAARLKLARRAYLTHLQVDDPWLSLQHVDESKLVVDPNYLPSAIDFSNYHGPGQGLSSKDHLNKQNTIDDAALISFAKQGNLTALKNYQYDAYDKETKAYLGKKPILEHPNKDIKGHYSSLVDVLTGIANPPIKSLDIPSFGSGDAEDVSEDAGYVPPGKTTKDLPPEQVIGFWMKLGHVGADIVADLTPKKVSHFKLAAKALAKSWYSKLPTPVKALINSIQDTPANNRFWNQGQKTVNLSSSGHHYNGPVQALANQAYHHAVEHEEGTVINRWMNMDKSMMDQLLQEGPGLVFQNTDTMCCSLYKDWGDNSHFGSGAFLKIRYAKGAKAMDSFGSGRFNSGSTDANGDIVHSSGGEMEVTTLMGQRFVVLGAKKGNNSSSSGITLDLLLLPPHAGYLAELDSQTQLGKSILFITRRINSVFPKPLAGAHHAFAAAC